MSAHVDTWLQRYLDGAVPAREAAWIAEHLLACERCRALHADVARGRQHLEALGGAGDDAAARDATWAAITSGLPAHRARMRSARRRRIGTGLLAAAAAVIAAIVFVPRARVIADPRWGVESLAGAPVVNGRALEGVAPVDATGLITTDSVSRARLHVRGLGTVDLAPDSRARILESAGARVAGLAERRMALDRGSMHARVLAPPRLLVVETPTATAIDLGCEYELAVAEDGSGLLRVRSGRVALAWMGREVVVRAGEESRFGRGIEPSPRLIAP